MNARLTIAAVVLAVSSTLIVGCGAAPDGSEAAGSGDEALMKQFGDGPTGGGSYVGGAYSGNQCDPNTKCCFGGSPGWPSDAPTSDPNYNLEHNSYLLANALRSPLNCTTPQAVGQDSSGHWWFSSTCLHDATWGPWVDVLVNGGAGINAKAFEGSNHCTGTAPAGYVNVLWDPLCPSGCTKLN